MALKREPPIQRLPKEFSKHHRRMQEESWSLDSLDLYKKLRRTAAIYNETRHSYRETIAQYMQETGCTENTAREHLTLACQLRSRTFPTKNDGDAEPDGTDDELYPDSFDYVRYLWNDMEAPKVEQAFNCLSYRDQTLLEQRNAICMHCGRVSPLSTRPSFETLATLFEGSGPSGAERAYKKALEKLAIELARLGVIHCVRFRQKSVQRRKRDHRRDLRISRRSRR